MATPTHASRAQLSTDVASYVRELIISGEARPGDFLRTEPLAAAIGVSNTPVREGLLLLSGEGFVELVPRRGFCVNSFSPQDVRDLFWAQATLAGELAGRAAQRIDGAELALLADLIDQHTRAADDGGAPDHLVALCHNFHRTVNLAADSRRLTLMLGSLVRQLPNRFYIDIEGQNANTLSAHPEILVALHDRDSDGAARLMTNHIMSGGDKLVATLRSRGLWA